MIAQLENLTQEERELLFKAPVLVSALASVSFNEVNKTQKADAIKLAHLKTVTANPLLIPYYKEVAKNFKEQFEAVLKEYFPFDDAKRNALIKEIGKVNLVIAKLDKPYAQALHTSFEKYARHVKRATHTVFMDFLFPVPIHGLND